MLEKIRSGEEFFHAIEIMACKGGCVGGGGQPFHHGDLENIIKKRTSALDTLDAGRPLRKSHENPYIKEIYAKYFDKPLSHKAHELLHTKYYPKK
jgi:NADH-quinone oxidoreductase subunit G/NADP-reducing hydrogenase subunit HndD